MSSVARQGLEVSIPLVVEASKPQGWQVVRALARRSVCGCSATRRAIEWGLILLRAVRTTAICRRTDLLKNYAVSASFLAPEPQAFDVPQCAGSVVLRPALGGFLTEQGREQLNEAFDKLDEQVERWNQRLTGFAPKFDPARELQSLHTYFKAFLSPRQQYAGLGGK